MLETVSLPVERILYILCTQGIPESRVHPVMREIINLQKCKIKFTMPGIFTSSTALKKWFLLFQIFVALISIQF